MRNYPLTHIPTYIPPEPDALHPPVSVYTLMQLHAQQLADAVMRSCGYVDDDASDADANDTKYADKGIIAIIDTTVSKLGYR